MTAAAFGVAGPSGTRLHGRELTGALACEGVVFLHFGANMHGTEMPPVERSTTREAPVMEHAEHRTAA